MRTSFNTAFNAAVGARHMVLYASTNRSLKVRVARWSKRALKTRLGVSKTVVANRFATVPGLGTVPPAAFPKFLRFIWELIVGSVFGGQRFFIRSNTSRSKSGNTFVK
jgi:hypothetical protein